MIPGVSDNTFAIVVPTLNEAGNIDKILTAVTDALNETQYEWEIVVVDDGSTDGTVEQVRDWAKRDSRVRLLMRSRLFIRRCARGSNRSSRHRQGRNCLAGPPLRAANQP